MLELSPDLARPSEVQHLLGKIHLPLRPVDSVQTAECNKPNFPFPFLKGLAY